MAEANYLHITQESNEYYVPLAAFFDSKKQNNLHIRVNESATADTLNIRVGDSYSKSYKNFRIDNPPSYSSLLLAETGSALYGGNSSQYTTSLYLTHRKAKFSTSDAASRPYILGIETPLSEASTTFNITEEELPYQAVNKNYVDTNFQVKLESGTNIKSIKDDKTAAQSLLGSGSLSFKTINNQSLLGTGNITIEGGGGTTITVDGDLSDTSTNPVQNKVITAAINSKQDSITDTTDLTLAYITANSGVQVGANNTYRQSLSPNGLLYYIPDKVIPEMSMGIYQHSDKTATQIKFTCPNQLSDVGNMNIRITGIAEGLDDVDAVNVSQLNTKQDKFATLDSTNKKINLDPTEYSTIGVTDGSLISFGSELVLNAISNIRVTSPVLMQTTNIHNDNYTITWDSDDEAIVITFS